MINKFGSYFKKGLINLPKKFHRLLVIVSILVLINNKINAEQICMTEDNFEDIEKRLKENDLTLQSLEIKYVLKIEELSDISNAMEDNREIGYIKWHDKQPRYPVLEDIRNKLLENNKKYRYYPSDYIYGLLSKHAYINSQKGDSVKLGSNFDEYLEDWKVIQVYDDTKKSGYYGVIYSNDKTHQVVLANRGTEEIIGKLLEKSWLTTIKEGIIALFNKNSDWKTNLEEILGGQIIVGQQAQNLRATAKAIQIAQDGGYRLSFTGHSLGAWLAELSTYYSYAYFEYRNVKSVTFESPGTEPMMKRLRSNIKNKDAIKGEDLDIVTYLAAPNPVNSCNKHVGRVYRVESEMKLPQESENAFSKIINYLLGKEKLRGIESIKGHELGGIIATFDPTTGRPRKCKKMLDWPRVQFSGVKSFSSEGEKITEKIVLSGITMSGLPHVMKPVLQEALNNLIDGTMTMTLMGFLKTYINGGIDAKQYWSYFKNIEEKGEKTEELSFDKRFSLYTLAKYREGKDRYLMDLKSGSVDKYLSKLYEKKGKVGENRRLPLILKDQLNELLEEFTIERNKQNGEALLIPNAGYDIERIRERAQRLLDVFAKEIEELTAASARIPEPFSETDVLVSIDSNLHMLTSFYIGIQDKESELEDKCKKETIVVISGLGGMGKSTLATKYGLEKRDKGWQVRWLKGMQIEEEFYQLAWELKIKTNDLSPDEVRDLVYKKLREMGQKEKPVLLIFDNVEDREKIKHYLDKLSGDIKVIITTRDSNLLKNNIPIKMEGFNQEQAINYVKATLQKKEEDARKLIEVVGLSPFRLSKAVAYWSIHSLTNTEEYIYEYEKVKMGHKENEDIYPEVEMLFRDLQTKEPESWRLLKYMAYLDADGVSKEHIMQLMDKTQAQLQPLVNNLLQLSLMNVINEGTIVTLKVSHRLVQAETKKALNKEQCLEVLEALSTVLLKNFQDEKRRDELNKLIRHLNLLIQEIGINDLSKDERKKLLEEQLLSQLASYYSKNADYNEALVYHKKLVDYSKIYGDGNYYKIVQSLFNLSNIYSAIGGEKNLETALDCLKEALTILKKNIKGNDRQTADVLYLIGENYEKLVHKKDTFVKALEYDEKSLAMYCDLYPDGNYCVANALCRVGVDYFNLVADDSKFLEYLIQAYSIAFSLFKEKPRDDDVGYLGNSLKHTNIKSLIESRVPDFFKGNQPEAQPNCFGGYKAGLECRWIITSRGKNENLNTEKLIKIKLKIQKDTLNKIVQVVDDYGWSKPGLFSGDWGVKSYLEKDYLKEKLGEMGKTTENIEIARMLCFESMNIGIMKSNKKPYSVVEGFVQNDPEFVKKIAEKHPEFFVDGSIVEACLNVMSQDSVFMNHIFKHVKYIGMEELRKHNAQSKKKVNDEL